MAEQIIIEGPGQDNLRTGAQKINAAILELALKTINAGGVPSIQAGLMAQRPAATGSGAIYIATDQNEGKFYQDAGINNWRLIGGGDVDWNNILQKPDFYPPSEHAFLHSIGGSDPITPAAIGAITLAALTWANIADKPAAFTPAFHKGTHSIGQSDALTPGDIGAATVESLAQKASKAGDTFTGNVLFRQEIQIGDTGIKLVKTADGVVELQFATGTKIFKVDGKTVLNTGNFPVMLYDRNNTLGSTTATSYPSYAPFPKTFKVVKSTSYGLSAKKLNIIAELWISNAAGTATLQVKIDGVEKLVLTTQSTTMGNLVYGTIDVSDWVDNSAHKVEVNIKSSNILYTAYIRLTELYVGVM